MNDPATSTTEQAMADATSPAPLDAPRCAVAARDRGDRMWGTAAPAVRLLLLEHPGPWARQALASPGIRPEQASELGRAADATRTRTLLVRRPGRDGRSRVPGAPRHWRLVDLVARTEVSGAWTTTGGLAEVVSRVRGWSGSGEPATPATLVCTHGVHDACCAIWGRPVIESLADSGEDLWECSHVGGDRFAASALVLPQGACYGGLDGANAVDVLAGHRDGAVRADHLRGLSSLAAPAQAAVAAALRDHGPGAVDSVREVGTHEVGTDAWSVDLEADPPLPQRLTARVERRWGGPARLTCRSGRPAAPFTYVVEWVEG